MRQLVVGVLGVALLLIALERGARADESMVTAPPPDAQYLGNERPVQTRQTWEEYEYESLKRDARRSRNALIGTSAATLAGFGLAMGFSWKCAEYNPPPGSDRWCSTRGQEAGLTIGAMMFWGGAIGALTTGIMLGVRKGKMRRLDDQIRLGQSALHWDPVRSRFAF